MRYQVFGHDAESGQPVEPSFVDAEDEQDARNRATEQGISVDRVVPAPALGTPHGLPGREAGTAPSPTGPAVADHRAVRGLVWVLRVLALVALIWGVMEVSKAVEASRVGLWTPAGASREAEDQADRLAQAAAIANRGVVFQAVFFATVLPAVLLALAEGLRLAIAIEGNTRRGGGGPSL